MDINFLIFISVMAAAAVVEIVLSMKHCRKSTVLLPLSDSSVTADVCELILKLSEKTPVYVIDMGLSEETAEKIENLRENIFIVKCGEILTYL